MNNKQRYAILKKNKEQRLKYYSIKDESGIYILTRYDDTECTNLAEMLNSGFVNMVGKYYILING